MKRLTKFFLIMCIIMCTLAFAVVVDAADLTITQPQSNTFVSQSNLPTIKWNAVSGAAGYRVSVLNNNTQQKIVSNEWTTSRSFDLSDYEDDIPVNTLLKIFVGAMASENDDVAQTNLASKIIWITVSEVPEVTVYAASGITENGATLSMNISKDFGSAIIDSGFYIGTSSSISKMTKYSFDDYGSYSATSKGDKSLTVTWLEPDTKYYFRAYAENGVGEEYTTYKTFWTDEETGSLSVDKTSVSLAWGSGNEASVNVTYSGSYSVSIDYDVSSSAVSGYDYEWLTYNKSGGTLTFLPKRANYSASARSAEVTITSGSQKKYVTVTQAKCGESAPTITLKRAGTTFSNGATIGSFTLPQEVMEIDVIGSNIRKLTAQLRPMSDLTVKLDESTSLNMISLDISDVPAGDYAIYIYASNSSTSNDYWAQSPFANGVFKLYFTLTGGNSSGSGEGFGAINSAKDYPNIPQISKNASESSTAWTDKNTIVYVQQQYSSSDLYDSTIWGTDGGTGKCTRASTSSAFSYLNIKALPKYIGDTIGSYESSSSCGCSDVFNSCYISPYSNYANSNQCSVENLKFCDNEMTLDNFVDMYNRYANDTEGKYSPIVFYTNYYNNGKSMHTLLIVGHSADEDNVFYVLNPGNNTGNLERIKLKVVDGQVRIEAKTKAGSWSTDHYNVNYTPCQVWQYVKKTDSTPTTIPITSVSLNKTSESLTVGNTLTLTATVAPTNATNKNVTWTSSNTSVATVANGVVTAKSAGTATITVTTVDGSKTATCTITVNASTVSVTGVTLDKTSANLTVGETLTLTATVSPTNATDKTVSWYSSNEAVATISSSGKITAKAAGTTVVWAESNSNPTISASCTVTVKAATVAVTGVTLNKTSESLTVGNTLTLTATVAPTNATNKNVSWSSNNTSVATVSASGVVTAKSAGTATITVTTVDGSKKATCNITVNASTVSVTGVTLDKTSANLTVGETLTLTATVTPTNATNKNVTWTSSNTSVATVSNGVVTAKAAGTATITVTTADGGKTTTCTVTVVKNANEKLPIIAVSKANGKAGKAVEISINIDNNPGIAVFGFDVYYDSNAMTLDSVSANGVFESSEITAGDITKNPYTVSALKTTNTTANGNVVTLSFIIKDNCPEGNYPVTIKNVEAYNINEQMVSFDISNGSISIINTIPGDITGDGNVNRLDLLRLAKKLAGWDVEIDVLAADVTGDGIVNRLDLLRLAKKLAGWDVELV